MDYDDYRESSKLVFLHVCKEKPVLIPQRGSERVKCRLVDYTKHFVFGFQNGFNVVLTHGQILCKKMR